MSDFSWGVFVALAVGAILIAMGAPLGPVLALISVLVLLFAFRYTYLTFYVALFLVPFLGFTITIPTGELAVGQRAFGGSIDISVAEAVLLAVLAAWALKILFLWLRRHDTNWKPLLPLARSYAVLLVAHFTSAFSSLEPDPVLVLKFALRPVLFCYLAFIALPVNLLRSRRRLVAALGVLASVGMIAALNGAVSLFFVDATSQFIRRAHPLAMFGVAVLGDNHNLLAELMAITVPITLALATLSKRDRTKRLVYASAALQFAIGLLTFSRTVWIVFILEAAFLGLLEFRELIRKQVATFVTVALILLPLVGIMAGISASDVAQSSNSSRAALLEIAYEVFQTSPWIGSGAGTFLDRVGSAQVFAIEYGAPLDAHGFIQKLAAETGAFGLFGFGLVLFEFAWLARAGWRRMPAGPARRAVVLLMASAGGAVAYQLFNTNYWTGKMWLPIGLTLTALNALRPEARDNVEQPL